MGPVIVLQPPCCAKAFPLGGRCPSAHTGADEGAILYPTFPCRKGGYCRSPRRASSPAPLGNPVAPSSVTSGDSFPPRGSLRRWYTPATKYFLTYPPLPQNAHPNQGTYMGHETAQPPPRCAPPRQNQRASSERAIKKGVQGACPRPSFSPFLGRNGDPRRAGGATGRCAPRQLRSCPPEGYAGPAALGPRPHLPMETVSHFGNKPKTLSQQVGGILIPTRFLRGPDCRPQRESAAR